MKTKFENIDQEDSRCSEDPNYGPLQKTLNKVALEFINIYNCTLPWMSDLDYINVTSCKANITDQANSNDSFVTYPNMVKHYLTLYENFPDPENILPCHRSAYTSLSEEKATGYGSDVFIQYETPNIQVIKDSYSYDMQSLIGEVGGTLGLLLGFSFASIFDLFDNILDSLAAQIIISFTI